MERTPKTLSLILTITIAISLLFMPFTSGEIISNQTLGPLVIRSAGDGGTNVNIVTIQDNSSLCNPVELTFRVQASLIPYCYSSIGDIGYSMDDGPVYRVDKFINQTIVQGISDIATVWASVNLPSLSEGSHKVTVYWGWYFEGINQRYDVSAYSTANFTVISPSPPPSPSLTPTPSPEATPANAVIIDPNFSFYLGLSLLIVVVAVFAGLMFYFKKRKH